MKKVFLVFLSCFLMSGISFVWAADYANDEIGQKADSYFKELFLDLGRVAAQDPTVDDFREIMRPVVEKTDGIYGATLIDPEFVIRQIYFHSHFLARGFDLKKVKELENFYKMMKENPAPQLSEPGHGSLFQPRLIAMRYPVVKNGELKNIVSMMVRTQSFLKATGLDKCKAYKIICQGKLAEERSELSEGFKEVKLSLPSTEWVIQYEK